LGVVNEEWPDVYIKSRARRFGPEVKFLVTLSAAGDNQEAVESLLASAWQDLKGTLAEEDIEVLELERA
jgi:hypothetical protein